MFFELGPIASMPHFGFVWSILPCFLIYLGSCLGKGMMVLSLKARSSALSLCALCWLTPLVEEPACEVHVFVGLLRESFGERIQVKNYLCTVPIISFELVWLFNFLFFFYIIGRLFQTLQNLAQTIYLWDHIFMVTFEWEFFFAKGEVCTVFCLKSLKNSNRIIHQLKIPNNSLRNCAMNVLFA